MILPVGTDRPLARPTLVNHVLIAVHAAAFVALAALARFQPEVARDVDLRLVLRPAAPESWAFFTYAFLHADFLHLAGNMLFLWVFGPNVEDRFGRPGYLGFYLAGAAVAGGLHALFETAPVVGASGAVAAVTGAYLVLFPRTTIKVFLWFFVIGIFHIPALWFIGFRIAWDLALQGTGAGGRIATLAHLGGYGWGIAVGMFLLGTCILPREPYDLFTIARQAARRRQLREAVQAQQRRGPAGPRATSAAVHDAAADDLARARAAVTRHLAARDLDEAAAAYRRLLGGFGATPGAATLSRRQQYDLANHLFQAEDYQTARIAYQRFLDAYPRDPESPHIKLMLGRINARYLNDPVEAKRLLGEAIAELRDDDALDMARRELAELG